MSSDTPAGIAAVSMARNDEFFIRKWIDYYGRQFGRENLFLILDGHDQALPEGHETINVIRLPHAAMSRSRGDRNRARMVSYFARALFHRYQVVIAHDIDEFLVIDPAVNINLSDYLRAVSGRSSLSALGLDVGQHLDEEKAIEAGSPFLEQRSYAHVSARYTKPVVALRPLTWGSGFHRIKGRNFRIDPNLFLFHFGMVDYEMSVGKTGNNDLLKSGWTGHFDRRLQLFELIRNSQPVDGDSFFRQARRRQSVLRPFYALNKPGMLRDKPIIKIPDRFRSVI